MGVVSITRPIIRYQANLGGNLLVATGNILSPEQPEVVVAGDSKLYVFRYSNGVYYLAQTVDVNQNIISLDVGVPILGTELIVVGTEDRLLAYGNRGGTISFLWQTPPESDAQFNNLVLTDLDGDGREELATTSQKDDTLFIYNIIGQSIETSESQLLGIRQLPGDPTALAAFRPNPDQTNYLAIAYQNEGYGIQTLFLTEGGFAEGPSIGNQSNAIIDLTAADLLPNQQREELAGASSDGSVKIFRANAQLSIGLTTNNLGNTVTAVDAKNLTDDEALLVAGTPGNYVFGFYSPNLTSQPNWVFRAAGPVSDLAIIEPAKVAVGSRNGIFQIWELL